MEFDTSSLTSNDPSGATATPTGRPQTLPSGVTNYYGFGVIRSGKIGDGDPVNHPWTVLTVVGKFDDMRLLGG